MEVINAKETDMMINGRGNKEGKGREGKGRERKGKEGRGRKGKKK